VLHTQLYYYAPGIRTIRTTRVLHSLQGLQLCCSRSHHAGGYSCLSFADSHILHLRYCYISDAALAPSMFSLENLSHIAISVSNGSGLPGFGPGWNRSEGPGPGQEPSSNPTLLVLAGWLPGPDINPRVFGRVEPGPRFHSTVPVTITPIKYMSFDHFVT